jgi:hypothetical protein
MMMMMMMMMMMIIIIIIIISSSSSSICSMSAPHVKIVPLIDAHQLLMLFAGTLTYLEPKLFSLIIFYNDLCIILKH